MKNKITTIIGNVGSGKSTLLNLLGIGLNAHEIAADELFKINPIFPEFVKDMKKWAFVNELWFTFERVKMIEENINYLKRQDLVIDSGLLMGFVYSYNGFRQGYFSELEWEKYQQTYDLLTNGEVGPDVVIYLKGNIDFLLDRISKRGRKYEIENYNKKYLKELEEGIDFLIKKLNDKEIKIIEFDIEKKDFMNKEEINQLVEEIRR